MIAAGYVLTASALCLVLVLHQLPILFAGLLVYASVDALAPGLQRHVPGVHAHRLAVAVLAALVVGVLTLAIAAAIFAQTKISALNTLFTATFLLIGLPLFGVSLPLAKTLVVVTFVAGLLPVIGNLISNTLIVIVALSISLVVALAALAFLIVIHKLEYFLSARIIGTQIQASAWELLIAMLMMEALFGGAGLIAHGKPPAPDSDDVT